LVKIMLKWLLPTQFNNLSTHD